MAVICLPSLLACWTGQASCQKNSRPQLIHQPAHPPTHPQLLCAGVTVYAPLRRLITHPGTKVTGALTRQPWGLTMVGGLWRNSPATEQVDTATAWLCPGSYPLPPQSRLNL